MHAIVIDCPNDPRLLVYRELPSAPSARRSGRFVVEGALLVRRLLQSNYVTESILVEERLLASFLGCAADDVPVYVASRNTLRNITGFDFHRGVLACGVRAPRRDLDWAALRSQSVCTLVACADIQDQANLGGMLRNAAALGVDAVLVGGRSVDAFSRRVMRVSMGAPFRIPIVESPDLAGDLRVLREELGVELAAAVLGDGAEPLEKARRGQRLALLFGNEANGLGEDWLRLCDRRVTIPMHRGADSLNVAVACGIFLYHFTRTE